MKIINPNLKRLWDEDVHFQKIYQEVSKRTLVHVIKCYMIYQYASFCKKVPGKVAEVGVFQGGTAKLIAKIMPSKKVCLFDTFEGMPKTDCKKDKHKQADFNKTSLDLVKQFMCDCKNIEFYKGFL